MSKETVKVSRRLLQRHKMSLFRLALEKFNDPKARLAVDKAEARFVASFLADYDRQIAPHLRLFEANVPGAVLTKLHYPSRIMLQMPDPKTFDLPDGTKVEREGTKTVQIEAPLEEWKLYDHTYDGLIALAGNKNRSISPTMRTFIELGGRGLFIPGLSAKNNVPTLSRDDNGSLFWQVNHVVLPWVSMKSWKLLDEVFLKAKALYDSELALLQAAAALIVAAEYYEPLLKVWPEAAQIENDLFPRPNAPVNQVIALNDEHKALLFANMRSRKVPLQAGVIHPMAA